VGIGTRIVVRKGIVAGIVAVIAIAVVAATLILATPGTTEKTQPLEVGSWSIDSNSYYPRYCVDISEDLRLMHPVDVTFVISNQSTGERAMTISGGGSQSYENGITQRSGRLDLQNVAAGAFDAHLFINATKEGGQEPTVQLRFHDVKEIILPADRPPLPQVTGVLVVFNSSSGAWHYRVDMTDPDADYDTLDVYLSSKGYTIYHARINNSDNATAWSFEAEINVTLSHEQYRLTAQVYDKDGPYSTEWMVPIYP
jgi:hypothetical protein